MDMDSFMNITMPGSSDFMFPNYLNITLTDPWTNGTITEFLTNGTIPNFQNVTSADFLMNDTLSNTSAISTMSTLLSNTTTEALTRRPAATPPPIGYYGDTRKALWRYLPPLIMVWGTIGNLLTILVILRQMKGLSSTAIYLMALAVSDTVVLYTGPLRNWVRIVYDIDVRDLTEAGCRAQVYITYASLHLSSWLLVAVSVERALCVAFPHKVRLTCTKNKAVCIIVAMIVVIFGINSVLPVIHGLEGVQNQKCSLTTKEFLEFRDNVWQWIDLCMAFAVPFVILLVCNTIILIFVHRSKSQKRKLAAGSSARSGANTDRNTRSVSLLMVALCLIFFLTMTPASVFAVYYPYKFEKIQLMFRTDPHAAWYDYQYLMFQHAVVTIVSYTNAAFNFILYVFSGTKFRNELWAMFTCKQPGKHGMLESNVRTSSSYVPTSTATSRSISTAAGSARQANGGAAKNTGSISKETNGGTTHASDFVSRHTNDDATNYSDSGSSREMNGAAEPATGSLSRQTNGGSECRSKSTTSESISHGTDVTYESEIEVQTTDNETQSPKQ